MATRKVACEEITNEMEEESDSNKKVADVERDDTEDGLCEYERIRQNNIDEREAMFANLEIPEAKSAVSSSRKK